MEPRIGQEQAFHDRQARQRAQTFDAQPEQLAFDENAYLSHETWIRPAFARLGDVAGLSVLDFGCGHGMAALALAKCGAHVTAFDLSHGYLDEARERASFNGLVVQFVQADGHRLPFADASFDRIWGNAVLHHLDLNVAAAELRRVLRPDGCAVFCEPWGENRLVELARRQFPYPGKHRTVDEEPLRLPQLQTLRQHFPSLQMEGFQLLSMVRRVLPRGRITAGLDWCDDLLLKRVPTLQNYCRYVVLTLSA
jgi:ubiquinone/menaquinone biosynthesis C-methylase UbiE